jgi:hypothetical protein
MAAAFSKSTSDTLFYAIIFYAIAIEEAKLSGQCSDFVFVDVLLTIAFISR